MRSVRRFTQPVAQEHLGRALVASDASLGVIWRFGDHVAAAVTFSEPGGESLPFYSHVGGQFPLVPIRVARPSIQRSRALVGLAVYVRVNQAGFVVHHNRRTRRCTRNCRWRFRFLAFGVFHRFSVPSTVALAAVG